MSKYGNYKTIDLDPMLVSKVQTLETELRAATNKEVLLLAYEENRKPT